MSLTGGGFIGLLVLGVVATFTVIIVLWPRLGGTRLLPVLSRVGLLLGLNALVLLTAGAVLNAQYEFFADWTDLAGAFSGSPTTTNLQRGGNPSSAVAAPVPGAASAPASGHLPALPHGGVLKFTVTGRLSGISGQVVVQLPEGYADPAQAGRRYPVIETFQGYPGNATAWIGPMNLGGAIQAQVAAHKMGPALIISPELAIPKGLDTECVNGSPGQPQLETWLTRDVPAWAASTFRVKTARSSWATIGLSMGAWCAAMAAMLHPGQFSAAIVMGGYFLPKFSPFYEPYPPNSPLASRYDLVSLSRRSPPPVAMWVETSHSDPVSYPSSSAFLKQARAPTAVLAVVLQHAGHRISLWQGLLPGSLTWLGANVSGFAYKP